MPSHGSLTKAGKTRGHSPKPWKEHDKLKSGYPRWHHKKHLSPRVAKRRRFNMYLDEQRFGWTGDERYKY